MLRWILIGLVAVALSALLSRYLWSRGLKLITGVTGQTVHRLTPPGWIIWAAVFMTLGVAIVAWAVGQVGASLLLPVALLLALAYAAAALVALWHAFFHYVAWTSEEARAWDPWRKHRVVKFSAARRAPRPWPLHDGVVDVNSGVTILWPKALHGAAELATHLDRRGIRR